MKILIVTDAWEPQVNGVVRTLTMTAQELRSMGHEVELITPKLFKSFPCPTYPEISLALAGQSAVKRIIDRFAPDCLHIATEGPLGWAARNVAMKRGWPFTTSYHSRFPEYVNMRFKLPVSWSYALLRRFHNAAQANLAPTPAIVSDLKARGFRSPQVWSRGVDFDRFSPQGETMARGDGPIFLHVGRLAVEKQVDEFLKLDLPGVQDLDSLLDNEDRLMRGALFENVLELDLVSNFLTNFVRNGLKNVFKLFFILIDVARNGPNQL